MYSSAKLVFFENKGYLRDMGKMCVSLMTRHYVFAESGFSCFFIVTAYFLSLI